MRKSATEIYSIFGQIDKVIAEAMIAEGKATKIEQEDIPHTALFDDHDRRAFFAIILPREYQREYEKRVRDLTA